MRISATHDGMNAVVSLAGRLDGEAARSLSATLEDLLQEGVRAIEVDIAGVDYLSSAAIRVLHRFLEALQALRGSIYIVSPSATAREVLEAAGLGGRHIRDPELPRLAHPSGRFSRWGLPTVKARYGTYEVSHYLDQGVRLELSGPPTSLLSHVPDPARMRTVSFTSQTFGLGIGAIAQGPEDALPRLGELIGAEGTAAYLPTDGGRIPDYLLTYGKRAPSAVLAQGITWHGLFTDLMRFSTQPDAEQVPLSELAEVCTEMVGRDAVAVVAVAEMHGLIGASLRRSPTVGGPADANLTDLHRLRDLVSVTPEPAHTGSTAIVIGVAARRPAAPLSDYLRPLDAAGELQGHFHAAVFSYAPVPQRTVQLPSLVERLFTEQTLRDVLHLLYDDRGEASAGQTGLLRGVCWIAPVDGVEVVA